jgi:F0F1-type ATP synthase delta subunit
MIKVYSKIELKDELKKKITDLVKSKFGNDEISFLIDESIISGIKIDVNSEVIDLTVNNKLEKVLDILN